MLKSRPTAAITGFAQACYGTRGGADLPDRGTGNPEVDNAARASGNLGDRPLVVLTAGRSGSQRDPIAAGRGRSLSAGLGKRTPGRPCTTFHARSPDRCRRAATI